MISSSVSNHSKVSLGSVCISCNHFFSMVILHDHWLISLFQSYFETEKLLFVLLVDLIKTLRCLISFNKMWEEFDQKILGVKVWECIYMVSWFIKTQDISEMNLANEYGKWIFHCNLLLWTGVKKMTRKRRQNNSIVSILTEWLRICFMKFPCDYN